MFARSGQIKRQCIMGIDAINQKGQTMKRNLKHSSLSVRFWTDCWFLLIIVYQTCACCEKWAIENGGFPEGTRDHICSFQQDNACFENTSCFTNLWHINSLITLAMNGSATVLLNDLHMLQFKIHQWYTCNRYSDSNRTADAIYCLRAHIWTRISRFACV